MKEACNTYRDSLREQFDAGLDLVEVAEDHAATCDECRAYRDQITAMNLALSAMPLEVPRNVLVQRVKSRLAAEPAYTNDARWWLPAASLCTGALLCACVLYFAVPIDPWAWWDYASESSATPQWMLGEISLAQEIASAQTLWNDVSALLAPFSTPLLWMLAGSAAALLTAVNGAEAYRLRTIRRS